MDNLLEYLFVKKSPSSELTSRELGALITRSPPRYWGVYGEYGVGRRLRDVVNMDAACDEFGRAGLQWYGQAIATDTIEEGDMRRECGKCDKEATWRMTAFDESREYADSAYLCDHCMVDVVGSPDAASYYLERLDAPLYADVGVSDGKVQD